MMRQFMMNIPKSLDEAAEIDGATKWQLFWDVVLPLARPALVTLTIFTFIGNYNNLFWPLVLMKTPDKYTLPIGMLSFQASQGQQTHLLMAAVTMSVIPMIVIFVLLQKQPGEGNHARRSEGLRSVPPDCGGNSFSAAFSCFFEKILINC